MPESRTFSSFFPIAALAASLVGSLGCTHAAQGPLPSVPPAAVGFSASAATSCRTTGEAQVVVSNILADELQVHPRPGGFQVIVLDAVDPCLTVDVTPDGRPEYGGVLSHCPTASPPGEATATDSSGQQYFAHETWDGTRGRHLAVGVETWDVEIGNLLASRGLPGMARPARRMAFEHPFVAPAFGVSAEGDEQTEPKLSASAAGTFLLVWVEGDAVRAQPLGDWATPAGAPLLVSPEGATEVEHPAVALSPTADHGAEGLVVYAARTPRGLHVFATPVACAPGRSL